MSSARLGDGLDRRIDGVDLVIARSLAAGVIEIILQDELLGLLTAPLGGGA
jgi:hypothetical protein